MTTVFFNRLQHFRFGVKFFLKLNFLRAFWIAMFSFDGQYKTRRVVSLGGASKKVLFDRLCTLSLCRQWSVDKNVL